MNTLTQTETAGDILTARRVSVDSPAEAAELVFSSWQRNYGTRDYYRGRAKECWRQSRRIRRDIEVHGWMFNQDVTDSLNEEWRDLRKEAAELVRESRRV